MHSPWGINYSILKELGFTWDYLMWKISWVNVLMMLADAPRYKSKEKDGVTEANSFEDFKAFMD
ncbi:hypothetical protein J3L18_23235 [Mucilaginibacter gossypii]|uniref:hypothetical protein n=1 Tax=Mucilaginibacter gossypii TaxID=551996 RepID=UPI000DCE3019|nr:MULTISPECIES: hypothetical protein [Mucilaginibacter]QTE36029.1 hypothetical protein J3L18_23235 [Mucilaginibacter gossypii]RAV56703.1 hypothetical protein DIU36_14980 [Mucilaginibacter rubeus]